MFSLIYTLLELKVLFFVSPPAEQFVAADCLPVMILGKRPPCVHCLVSVPSIEPS